MTKLVVGGGMCLPGDRVWNWKFDWPEVSGFTSHAWPGGTGLELENRLDRGNRTSHAWPTKVQVFGLKITWHEDQDFKLLIIDMWLRNHLLRVTGLVIHVLVYHCRVTCELMVLCWRYTMSTKVLTARVKQLAVRWSAACTQPVSLRKGCKHGGPGVSRYGQPVREW